MTLVGIVGFATYPHAYNLLDLTGSAADRERGAPAGRRPGCDVPRGQRRGGRRCGRRTHRSSWPRSRGAISGKWARTVIDAGADAVIGHGPHVLRGVEFYHGRPVFYSLGNFVTYRGFNLEGPLGLTTALQLDLDATGGFLAARMPALIQRPDSGTAPDSLRRATALLRRITRLDFPGRGRCLGRTG